ncbi:hypothetical protein B296_00051461 [Ensete ventricosum]|uniref:Phosphoinositide phospholipase C n=1 Tax=Ensete ventricosum TaxID=4639 RepID=A0A426XUY8_ENSVE|nr:hypothetical protein B296_00051461 [Ensete ventricosum]
MGSYKYCICFTRKFVWRAAAPPPDVRQTFVEYSEGAAQMGPDQLRRFLAEAQGQAEATLADAERIIEVLRRRRCHHLPAMLSRPGITLDDFFHFLFSDDLNPPIRSQVGAALPQHPKRTLWSMLIRTNVVCFSHTFEMIKCLRSIKEFAFCASPYPVVITLEDHLTPDLQAKVAESLWQGYGRSLWLMQGLFRANGGCGYVRKPDFLMNIGPRAAVFEPEARLPVKITLKVTDAHPTTLFTDFQVGIAGVPADIKMKRTRIKQDDWMPVWGEEFSFPLTVPELALLRIEAHEYNMSDMDDFGGQTCLPVWELKPGIRAVPLHDHKGNKYKSVRLLMRFQFV